MPKDLVYEVLGRTALLTINRPEKRNAITQEMISDFLEYLDRVDEDNDVRAVCLTGAGEKAFCAGADLAGSFKGNEGENLSGAERYATLIKRLSKFSKPLVARVNGPCLAGGIGLMLSCDIAIARNDAFFSTPEVDCGDFSHDGGSPASSKCHPEKGHGDGFDGPEGFGPGSGKHGIDNPGR